MSCLGVSSYYLSFPLVATPTNDGDISPIVLLAAVVPTTVFIVVMATLIMMAVYLCIKIHKTTKPVEVCEPYYSEILGSPPHTDMAACSHMPSVDIEGDKVTTAQRPPDDPIGLRPPDGPIGLRPPDGPIGLRPPDGPIGLRSPDDPIGLRSPDEPIDVKDCEAYIERTALEAPPLPVQDEDDYI